MCCSSSLCSIGYYTSLPRWFRAAFLDELPIYYLCDLCHPVSDVAARRVRRSATCGDLFLPLARLAPSFSVLGPIHPECIPTVPTLC